MSTVIDGDIAICLKTMPAGLYAMELKVKTNNGLALKFVSCTCVFNLSSQH